MRLIFIALVAANFLLFLVQWFWLRPSVPSTVVQPPAAQLRVAVADSAPAERPAVGALCVVVGNFGEPELARAPLEQLLALELPARIAELEVPDEPGYRVYLRPEISKQEALRRLYELQAKQIDSYIFPRGELANGISLGMFSRQELAERRRDELRQLGYDPQIESVARTLREVWLVVPASAAESISSAFWQGLLARQPGLEKRQILCSSVASG